METDEELAKRVIDERRAHSLLEIDLARRLIAACEARKMLDEIERRNKEGSRIEIRTIASRKYYVYDLSGPGPEPIFHDTILEAWEAFEGRQR